MNIIPLRSFSARLKLIMATDQNPVLWKFGSEITRVNETPKAI
jgi:hypothetical protein